MQIYVQQAREAAYSLNKGELQPAVDLSETLHLWEEVVMPGEKPGRLDLFPNSQRNGEIKQCSTCAMYIFMQAAYNTGHILTNEFIIAWHAVLNNLDQADETT